MVAVEGEDHATGHLLQLGCPIEGIGDKVFLRGEDILRADNGPQPARKL